jgi:hypothetical protein
MRISAVPASIAWRAMVADRGRHPRRPARRIAAIAAVRAQARSHGADPTNRTAAPAARGVGRAFLDWLNRPADPSASPRVTPWSATEEVTARQVRDTTDMGCEGRTR